ncbi:MAG: DedA family protein [Sarcina sp.]
MEAIFDIFTQYGVWIIFIMIFLEHLNTPGLAAGVLLSAVGFLAYKGDINFLTATLVCLLAGVLASCILYLVGYLGGSKILDKIEMKFPKSKKGINKVKNLADNNCGRITCRFLPVIRTLAPIIEGGIKVEFKKFLFASVIGIGAYNMAIIGGGYFLGFCII